MKELLFHLSDLDTTAIHEFLVEIKLMSALHHRNVVQFLGIVYHEDRLYLVTVANPPQAVPPHSILPFLGTHAVRMPSRAPHKEGLQLIMEAEDEAPG